MCKRYAILAIGAFDYIENKTGNMLIRNRPGEVVSVIDPEKAGQTAQQVLGWGGDIPCVATFSDSKEFSPTHLVIGAAPQGGTLNDAYRTEINDAIRTGCHIISGMHVFLNDDEELSELAEKMNAPILADPISQLRFGTDSELIFANYDIFLRYKDIQPDLIIRIGRKPTSNVLNQLLKKWNTPTFLVDAWQQFNDDCPNFIQSRISDFCREQIKKINWEGSADWATQLISYENTVEDIIQPEMGFHEGAIAKCCVESIESGGQLFIGNSMPIRDVDMSTSTSQQFVTIYSNRGVSGIDGVVSTALGMCAEKNNTQSLLLIGDLSFYHDMNGLLAAKYGINLTIVVINNSGGGIFSFLPIANAGMENFQQFWTTDTGLNFKKAAELYNCWYSRAANVEELGDCIQKSFESSSIKIIEIRTDINENIENRRKFLKDVKQILSGI